MESTKPCSQDDAAHCNLRKEDQDPLAADSDDEESIGPPFLFLHDEPQIHISNIEGNVEWKTEGNVEWKPEDIEDINDIDDIIEAEKREEEAAASTELDPQFQRGPRSILFPDNPPEPEEHKIKREDPKIKLEPNLNLLMPPPDLNLSRTRDLKTKKSFRPNLEPNLNLKLVKEIKKERPTISKHSPDPKMKQIYESMKKSDIYNCAKCERSFDHPVKLSGHVNIVHSKGKVPKDQLYECPYPDCDYK